MEYVYSDFRTDYFDRNSSGAFFFLLFLPTRCFARGYVTHVDEFQSKSLYFYVSWRMYDLTTADYSSVKKKKKTDTKKKKELK